MPIDEIKRMETWTREEILRIRDLDKTMVIRKRPPTGKASD